mmetsp:Transcript_1913/g.4418  ORF Transcript_1913/g.4418 Transcript_1913/m.4418 type:complete len:215 (+) Transcript_1913:63-707(+)
MKHSKSSRRHEEKDGRSLTPPFAEDALSWWWQAPTSGKSTNGGQMIWCGPNLVLVALQDANILRWAPLEEVSDAVLAAHDILTPKRCNETTSNVGMDRGRRSHGRIISRRGAAHKWGQMSVRALRRRHSVHSVRCAMNHRWRRAWALLDRHFRRTFNMLGVGPREGEGEAAGEATARQHEEDEDGHYPAAQGPTRCVDIIQRIDLGHRHVEIHS